MNDVLVSLLLILGGVFGLLSAIGMVRMPDLFTRMQAATKAGTFGAGFILLAVAIHFGQLGVTTRALLVIAFLFLTAPVAAHVIARAGYFVGVPQWEHTVLDELRSRHESEAAQDDAQGE